MTNSPTSHAAPTRASRNASSSDAADVIRLYVVEYFHCNQQWRTVVEARDLESAKRQFCRDNPDVELLACY